MKTIEIKNLVLTHYSKTSYPSCNNCGFSDIRALCLDHINGDGKIHRKSLKYGKGLNLYKTLYKNDFKCDFELQTLCFNCNTIKLFENRENIYTRTAEWKANISKALTGEIREKGERSRRARKVIQFSLDGDEIKIWGCIKDAESYYNSNKNAKNIVACCNNRQHTAYGFIWTHLI